MLPLCCVNIADSLTCGKCSTWPRRVINNHYPKHTWAFVRKSTSFVTPLSDCVHLQHVFNAHILVYMCNQGQQADHVAKGVARQHELPDHHDCSHLCLT